MKRITKRQAFYLAVGGATFAIVGFVGWELWAALENHRVRQWVENYGGFVDYHRADKKGNPKDWRTPEIVFKLGYRAPIFDRISGVVIEGSPQILLSEVKTLARLRSLEAVTMRATTFSDAHLRILAENGSVTALSLWHTEVTDEGVAVMVEAMPQLDFLQLEDNPGITSQSLRILSRLPKLEDFRWYQMDFSDKDLEGLRSFHGLSILQVGERITDAGIEEIVKLEGLREVEFHGSKVTDAGIEKLIAGLPDLDRIFFLECDGVSRALQIDLDKSGLFRP